MGRWDIAGASPQKQIEHLQACLRIQGRKLKDVELTLETQRLELQEKEAEYVSKIFEAQRKQDLEIRVPVYRFEWSTWLWGCLTGTLACLLVGVVASQL